MMASSTRTQRPPAGPRKRSRPSGLVRAVIAVGVLAGLAVVFFAILNTPPSTRSANTQPTVADYAVGSPGPGDEAPGFSLPSTSGATVNLSDYRGETVLLYFHEGIGCQPCWDQIRDLDAAETQLNAVGVDRLLTITSGPVDLIEQKMADDKLTAVALADTKLDISRIYETNQYGMMGDSRNGHSFILVGPDGGIDWRADYGGSPNYTMYVPVDTLLSDMEAGRTDT